MSLETDTSQIQVTQGVVYKKAQGHYAVRVNGHVVDCEISSRLRKVLEYPIASPTSRLHRVLDVHEIRVIDPIAIGDRVEFLNADDKIGIITRVLPRRNEISRQGPGPRPVAQVIAANVDYIVHRIEPACAVKRAVEAETISEQRYTSYLRIREKMHEEK